MVLAVFLILEHHFERMFRCLVVFFVSIIHYLQGVVNDRFNEIICRRNTGERDHVVQLIESYLADVDMILAELSRHV